MTSPAQNAAPATVWVASYSTFAADHLVRPAATRDHAVRWLVSNIDPTDWAQFLKSVRSGASDDSAGLLDDVTAMDPDAAVAAYFGPAETDGDRTEWGGGEALASVEPVALWEPGTPD